MKPYGNPYERKLRNQERARKKSERESKAFWKKFTSISRRLSKRPTITCSGCGYSWSPRGKNYSLKCPNCSATLNYERQTSGGGGCGCVGCISTVVIGLVLSVVVLVLLIALSSTSVQHTPIHVKSNNPAAPTSATPAEPRRSPLAAQEIKSTQHSEEAPKSNAEQPVPHQQQDRASLEEFRLFRDDSGTYEVLARFVNVRDGQATLIRKDGRIIRVPLERLSEDDRHWVAEQSDK